MTGASNVPGAASFAAVAGRVLMRPSQALRIAGRAVDSATSVVTSAYHARHPERSVGPLSPIAEAVSTEFQWYYGLATTRRSDVDYQERETPLAFDQQSKDRPDSTKAATVRIPPLRPLISGSIF